MKAIYVALAAALVVAAVATIGWRDPSVDPLLWAGVLTAGVAAAAGLTGAGGLARRR